MAHVDPLRFAFNRRMLDALDDESCDINTNPLDEHHDRC